MDRKYIALIPFNSLPDSHITTIKLLNELYNKIEQVDSSINEFMQLLHKALIAILADKEKEIKIEEGITVSIERKQTGFIIKIAKSNIVDYKPDTLSLYYRYLYALADTKEKKDILKQLFNLLQIIADIYEIVNDWNVKISYHRKLKMFIKDSIKDVYVYAVKMDKTAVIADTKEGYFLLYANYTDHYIETYQIIAKAFHNDLKYHINKFDNYYNKITQAKKKLIDIAGVYILAYELGGDNV